MTIGRARRLFAATPWIGNDCNLPNQETKPPPIPWSGQVTEFFQDYRALDDIHRYLDLLAELHPELVTLREIGKSWQGRPLKVLEITAKGGGKTTSAEKPCIFLEGGIHSREWIATSTVLYIAGALLRDASKSDVQNMLQHFVFTILVPVNPDGYVYSWQVNRMWRKTRSNRSNYLCSGEVAGVDANRNWGVTFGQTDSATYESQLHNPCSEVFIGPEPFSEPETKAASDYMKDRQQRSLKSQVGHVAAFIDYHSYAQAMLPPWAYTAETPAGPDGSYQTSLTSFMNQAFFNTSGRTFNAGADVFPPDPGTGPDWAYGLLGIRATMTIELEGHSFCLPAIQIENVGREQFAAWLIGGYADLVQNAGVKALAAFVREHGEEPSAHVGLFAGEDSLLMAAHPLSVSQPSASHAWLAVLASIAVLVTCGFIVAFRSSFRWSKSSRNYSSESAIELE